jgi:peptide chain release factor 2
VSIGYNFTFLRSRRSTMEAERLNAIESLLADLRRRAGELRGYL